MAEPLLEVLCSGTGVVFYFDHLTHCTSQGLLRNIVQKPTSVPGIGCQHGSWSQLGAMETLAG